MGALYACLSACGTILLLLPSREKVAAKRTDEGAVGIFRRFGRERQRLRR